MKYILFITILFLFCMNIISKPIDSINLSSLSREQIVDTLLFLSKRYSSISLEKSFKYATDAMIMSENIDYPQGKLKAYITIGENNMLSSNNIAAMEYFFKAMSIAQNKHSQKDIAYTMDKIGDCYQRITDFESALGFYNDALGIYQKLRDRQGVTLSLIHIAGTYGMQQECDKALEFYDQAIKIAKIDNNKEKQIIILNGIGNCHTIMGNYDLSISFYKQSWLIAKEINDEQKIASLFNNIGNVYRIKQDYNNAIDYTTRGYEKADSTDFKDMTSTTLFNLAGIYYEKKEYKLSMDYLEKSRKVAEELGYTILKIKIWEQYVLLYQALGKFDKANEYHTLLVNEQNEKQKINNVARIANLQVLYNLAGKQQQLEELETQSEINKLKIKWFMILLIVSIILLISAVFLLYSRNKIIKRQKKDLIQEHNLKKLIEEKETEQINQLNQKSRTECEKHKTEIERTIIEKQQIEVQLEQITFEKQQIEVQLEQALQERQNFEENFDAKNRELASITMQLLQKNELFVKLRNEILKLKENPSQQIINELVKSIDYSIRVDKDWDTFLLHFKNVHTDFFDNLQQLYPDLTEKDLKQCAYIRMGLSVKEVATLMNISIRAVEKARMKIKTKMKLDSDINLNSQLQKISP